MQNPFWKKKNNQKLLNDLIEIIKSCRMLGIKFLVIPLVDNGSIVNKNDENNLIKSCKYVSKYLKKSNLKLIFESDFGPQKLKRFIEKFDKKYFGINYDVGNSAGSWI
jgi:L-ribulose-5-phosphate 3-epimerase